MPVPTLTFNDGHTIPQLGFGVFRVDPDETERIVTDALEVGYRHIDTASFYGNEGGVGRAIEKSGIPRDELFITTKLWNSDQGTQSAFDAIDLSLEKLGLDAVDLYLIHWPVPSRNLFVETWKAFEQIHADGKATSIGVSNFRIEDLERLAAETDTVPVINQIELHPLFTQLPLREYGAAHGILTESWGPLGHAAVNNVRRAADRRRGGRPRGVTGSGDPALAPAERAGRDPEVQLARADGAELRPLRLRADGRRGRGDQRAEPRPPLGRAPRQGRRGLRAAPAEVWRPTARRAPRAASSPAAQTAPPRRRPSRARSGSR